MGKEMGAVVFIKNEDIEQIMNAIVSKFGQEWNGSNVLPLVRDDVRCEIQVLCKFMGEDIKKSVNDMEHGMSDHMLSFPTEGADDVKGNLMHFITGANTAVLINIAECEGKDTGDTFIETYDDVMEIFNDILKQFGGGVIAHSDASGFYDENDDMILGDEGECEVEDYFPFEYVDSPEFLSEATERQMNRRNENMKFLFDNKIFCIELPINNDDEVVKIRSVEEIARRTVGVLLVSVYSECLLNPEENMKCKEALKFIKKIAKTMNIDDLREVMSPAEYAYVNNKKSKEEERIEYSWNYEHLYALEWALGLNEWNMPVDICNVGKCVEIMSKFSSIDDIINNSNMRSKKEILDKADLIYRMDWACVDAWIHGLTGPAQLNPGVTQARHKTLNWLINMDDAEWDDVSTPT